LREAIYQKTGRDPLPKPTRSRRVFNFSCATLATLPC
jgi:hypothetical protein